MISPRMTAIVALWLAACAAAHGPPRECDPALLHADCRADERCTPSYDGTASFCMKTCDRLGLLCESGEVCLYPRGSEVWVCWIGGPVARGEPCERQTACARGLRCNRDHVCEQKCSSPGDTCPTPGTVCEGVCQRPVPEGAPCTEDLDCSPPYACRADALFTCRLGCAHALCPDGSTCVFDEECGPPPPSEPFDACERAPEGSSGCWDVEPRREVCVMTDVGVRRCALAGCSPERTEAVGCSLQACLPDPEDPASNVCWPGGLTERGEPCESSYECRAPGACNAAGVCAAACTTEGEPCPSQPGHVCRDFVCMPEDP